MNKIAIKNSQKLTKVLGLSIVLGTTLTGCMEQSIIEDATEIYDVIDSMDDNGKIKPQVLAVPGEDFNLVVEYYLDEDTSKKWRITDNKKVYTKVYTQGLGEQTKVYIDNVHTDTTLVASKESMNGITQDSMDDHIHNSLMYGFPISDTTSFYATNEIEGQNDTFITGSAYGFNGYSNASITERRHSEQEYLEKGVYANKISSAYGLLIQKGKEEPYGVDVSSDIVILVNNEITTVDEDGKVREYKYNRDGSSKITEIKQKVKK